MSATVGIVISYVCALVALTGFLRLCWLQRRLCALTTAAVQRSIRLEMVVGAVRSYREHGTASTWLGVLAQLDNLDAKEPRCCPSKH